MRRRRSDTTHVRTGNSAYRVDALRKVGLLDVAFGYGMITILSLSPERRVRLLLPRRAERASLARRTGRYLVQQHGFGYGSDDLRRRIHGARAATRCPCRDDAAPDADGHRCSRARRRLTTGAAGGPWRLFPSYADRLVAGLALERPAPITRGASGRRLRLVFPLLHLGRIRMVAAIAAGFARRVVRTVSAARCMRPRTAVLASDTARLCAEASAFTTPPGPAS